MTHPLARRILRGDVRAAARLMRDLDDGILPAAAAIRKSTPSPGLPSTLATRSMATLSPIRPSACRASALSIKGRMSTAQAREQ